MVRLANVSVDMDALSLYHHIHALDAPAHQGVIYDRALPRLLDWFAESGLRATFFVVGADLARPATRSALRDIVAAGHEVANHSFQHDYRMRTWSERSIASDIERAAGEIAACTGSRPLGFRTPGYNVDITLVRLLAEQGYSYDSSVFPCPAYAAAKAVIMGAMWLAQRPSASGWTDPRMTLAPTVPYRPSRHDPFKRGDRKHSLPLWEIPIGVTPSLRMPLIGTNLGALPVWAAARLGRQVARGASFLQLELHAIDLLDRDDPEVDSALVRRQPDLRRSWRDKRASLHAFVEATRPDMRWVRLDEQVRVLDQLEGRHELDSRRRAALPKTVWTDDQRL